MLWIILVFRVLYLYPAFESVPYPCCLPYTHTHTHMSNHVYIYENAKQPVMNQTSVTLMPCCFSALYFRRVLFEQVWHQLLKNVKLHSSLIDGATCNAPVFWLEIHCTHAPSMREEQSFTSSSKLEGSVHGAFLHFSDNMDEPYRHNTHL